MSKNKLKNNCLAIALTILKYEGILDVKEFDEAIKDGEEGLYNYLVALYDIQQHELNKINL